MKVHYKQAQALKHQTRFNFWLCGRRGGKTTGFVEDMARVLPTECPPGAGLIYIGPTNQDAKDIIWEDLLRRVSAYPHIERKASQRIWFPQGRFIQVIGAEKMRRVRGRKFYKAYLDEVAFYSAPLKEVWEALRPTLSDYGGGAIAATTPCGRGSDAHKFYLDVATKDEWSVTSWDTLDNPYIDPDEIEAARRELDPRSFEQEYLARWVSFEGLAYYTFDETIHVKKQPAITPELPLGLAFDFNVNPTTMLLGQQQDGKLRIKKEYSLKNSSTIKTVENFVLDFAHMKDSLQLNIHGDSTGDNRKSTTGHSDYYYIREILTRAGFKHAHCVPSFNPPIVDRLNHTNAWLMNAAGEHRVEVDPSCKDLIIDLSSQTLEGRFPSDKNNLGHKADALGYYIHWQSIAVNRKQTGMIQL